MANSTQPEIHTIFEAKTRTWQYIVADPVTKDAAVIDSMLDYDIATATITTSTANGLLDIIQRHNYRVLYILETNARTDHLTASRYIQQALRHIEEPTPKICVGKRIEHTQHTSASRYRIQRPEHTGAFDRRLDDGERLPLGDLHIEVLHLPGHTPDHVGYVIGSNVFTGDSLFQSETGNARRDFPGSDATALLTSMRRLLSLPSHYRLYPGHGYVPRQNECRDKPRAFTTVAEQREKNKHVYEDVSKEECVKWRRERDSTLGDPRGLHPALQFNIRAGQSPVKSEYRHRFVHVP